MPTISRQLLTYELPRYGAAKAALAVRRPFAFARRLPDFLIAGTMRGGTTSLYHYLLQHPGIARPLHKEVGYFSTAYPRGEKWYRSHFPMQGDDRQTFEASVAYMFDPRAPERAHTTCPDLKIIFLLRDPVTRAYSQWRMMVGRGFEDLSFGDAIAAEPARLGGELARMMADDRYSSAARRRYSYVARGEYLWQIEPWISHFGSDRVLVVPSEDLYTSTEEAFRRVEAFLGLPRWDRIDFTARSFPETGASVQLAMDTGDETRLRRHFEPFNEALTKSLDMRFPWG